MTQAMVTCSEQLLSSIDKERQGGVGMFSSLNEDEQEGVIGAVSRQAMQTPSDDTPLRSFIDLANNGQTNAAEALSRCIDRIGAANIPPGFGITLRTFKGPQDSRATQVIEEIRKQLIKTGTPVGRALQIKRKKRA